MDCIFKGLNTTKCASCRKCVGLEQLILELGGSAEFAISFSKYGFLRSFLNKLEDRKMEALVKLSETRKTNHKSNQTLFSYHLKANLCKIGQKIIGDPFQVEGTFKKIEKKFFYGEFSTQISTKRYFESAGEGYGFFFYYAAMGATKSLRLACLLGDFGNALGTLVCLRDMFKDLKSDRMRGKFNPFSDWPNAKIKEYYITYTKELQNELLIITHQILSETNLELSILTTPTQFTPNTSELLEQSNHSCQSNQSSQSSQSSCSIKYPKNNISVMDSLSLYIFSKQSLCARFMRNTLIPTPKNASSSSKSASLLKVGRKIGTLLSISALAAIIPGVAAQGIAESSGLCDGCCDSCGDSCCTSTCGEGCNCGDMGCCDSCESSCDDSCNSCCDDMCDSMCESMCESSSSTSTTNSTST
ncbi:MAG: hypothetical protein ACTSYU_09640 [Promethearchaeota archaeon]